ncbi:TenA family protein [Plastorhodobacter daqingensis]|uniref:Aminopyrimidine aminohydrolase n=1 Tax=Plastorhodobacter daqingensis TaxID=1387281 RepID=A0ABW2UJ34_9RHOB
MSPTEALRAKHAADWQAITCHPFTEALARGDLPLDAMRWYLVQDYRFIEDFVRLLAQAIAHAPSLADAVPGAQFLAVITGPENTYFQRSFDALGVVEAGRDQPEAAPTTAFRALMRDAAASGSHARMLAVLVVAEWSYLDWASRVAPGSADLPFYFADWITLHSGPGFEAVVDYLRGQLDAAWPGLAPAEQAAVAQAFARAVALERQFFDAAWARAT